MSAPLYESLTRLAERQPLRLDMPGHHGKGSRSDSIDFTEHDATGDLYVGGDAIEAAEQLWAEKWGADGALFLTDGSTEGVRIALHLCLKPGETVLIDRGSHRSAWNSLALLDAEPVFLSRPWQGTLTGPISPEEVEEKLTATDAKAVFVTSPTYYGICSDITRIAEIAHAHNAKLIVDCAHAAHFPWIGRKTPCEEGADLVVTSAHKTLPAPGQSALLLYRNFDGETVRRAGSIYGTSSPSYVMMAALDRVRDEADRDPRWTVLVHDLIPSFKERLEAETPFRIVKNDDPCRLVLRTDFAGYTGHELLALLEKQLILPEMADICHVVCILTCADGEEEFDRLLSALKAVPPRHTLKTKIPAPPELPRKACSLREAMFAGAEQLPLKDACGRISAVQIAPYPPGVPVILPGEEIRKKHVEYLKKTEYNINVCTCVIPEKESE